MSMSNDITDIKVSLGKLETHISSIMEDVAETKIKVEPLATVTRDTEELRIKKVPGLERRMAAVETLGAVHKTKLGLVMAGISVMAHFIVTFVKGLFV